MDVLEPWIPQWARKAARSARDRDLRAEHGFTLIEVLAAVALISFGVASTLRIFGASGRTVLRAERVDVATQRAQAELDRMRTLPYTRLALTTPPPSSSDPQDPGSRVEGTSLRVRPDLTEPFVMTPGAGDFAGVDPAPKDFAVGLAGATITGHIFRYVTWRDEACPLALCVGSDNTKRLTVAAIIDPEPGGLRRPPLWLSTVIVDPDAAPPGAQVPPSGGPGGGSTVTAQSFFLYDTPCGQPRDRVRAATTPRTTRPQWAPRQGRTPPASTRTRASSPT